MTIKVTYNSNDIYVSETISATYISVSYEVPSGGGGGVWGDITGTLSNQTDLQNALNAKQNLLTNPVTGTGVNGRVAYWSGTNTQTSSSTFLWDNTAQQLTIGAHTYTPPSGNRNITLGGALGTSNINFALNNELISAISLNTSSGQFTIGSGNLTDLMFYVNNTFAAEIFANTRNVLIQDGGTFTDNGARLQVTGTATISSGLIVDTITIGRGNNSLVNNTALGHSALLSITTGNFNTAVGYESLRNTTTGQYNTAIGQSSLFSNTTGGQNTALGLNALLYNTSGASNVAVGLDTLQHNTTGSSNTAIGYNAGSHITGGSTPNTTASNSIFIGRDSKAAADGQTNQIVIGQNAVGNGSNTATFGNTATTANYFTGSINGGSFVKIGGLSTEYLKADGSVSTLTNPITGTGTSGQVSYWNGTSTQAGSNNLFWDSANNRLGIGTNTPTTTLQVNGASTFNQRINLLSAAQSNPTGGSSIAIDYQSTSDLQGRIRSRDWDAGVWKNITYAGLNHTFETNSNTRFIINDVGRVLIGSTTDSGQRLQVTGDTLLKGSGNTSATNALLVENSDGTDILQVRNDGAVFIGSIVTTQRPYLAGYTNLTEFGAAQRTLGIVTQFIAGNRPDPAILIKNSANLDYTSGAGNFLSLITNYSPTSGTGVLNNYVIQPTINQTGGANGITRGLYVNPTLTAAADWRSIEWSNNTGWGLRGEGTAPNLLNGNLGIGGSAGTSNLSIGRNITGATSPASVLQTGIVQSDATSLVSGFRNELRTASSVFNITAYYHYWARVVTIGAGSTLTSQAGFSVDASLTSATNNYGFLGEIPSGTGRWNLYMNGTANNYMAGSLGIGATTNLTSRNLSIVKNITGSATAYSVVNDSQVQSDVTGNATGFFNGINTANTTFTLNNYMHFDAVQGTIGASSTVTNQYGFRAASSLTGATNNFGFRGDIAAATGRWNFYANGTAANFFAGVTQIGAGALTSEQLQVNGTAKITGASSFGGNMTLSLNQNAGTNITVSNSTSNTGAVAFFRAQTTNSVTVFDFGKFSPTTTAYKIISANDGLIYNSTSGDIAIFNDATTGNIKFASGGSSTAHMTIRSNGRINMSSLPTSATGLSAGDLWNDGGTLKIV